MKTLQRFFAVILIGTFTVSSALVLSNQHVLSAASIEVTVSKPQLEEAVPKGKPMTIEAVVKNCTNVSKVEFFELAGTIGGYGKKVGEDTTYPYSITFTPTDYSTAQSTRFSKNHISAKVTTTTNVSVLSESIRFYVYPESEFIATVCRWKDNKKAAYTPTYDDNWLIGSHEVTNTLHKTHGIKGTIFWDTSNTSTFPRLNTILSSKLFDVGAHSVTHPLNFAVLSTAEMNTQFSQSQSTIATQTGVKPYTYAYPCYITNAQIASEAMKYFIAARWGSDAGNALDGSKVSANDPSIGINDPFTLDYMYIKAMCPAANTSSSIFNGWLDQTIANGGWLVTSMHGLSELHPTSWKPQSKTELGTHYAYAKTKIDSNLVWNDTFENIAFYLRERNASVINPISSTVPNQYKFNINLIDYSLSAQQKSLMTRDITMRVSVPTNWSSATVYQGNGASNVVSAVNENGLKFLYFNAKPLSGDVVVTKYN